jgi:hypothetical protein
MLDEIRNHDSLPTAEEERWMTQRPMASIARMVILGAVAVIIGWAMSDMLDTSGAQALAAVQQR